MNKQIIKSVKVSATGVQFGSCWLSHEKITGYSADLLNAGSAGLVGDQYTAWLSTDEPEPVLDEAKEREMFMARFPLPSNVQWSEEHQNFGWVRKDAFKGVITYRALWTGWLACAKSRAGIKP